MNLLRVFLFLLLTPNLLLAKNILENQAIILDSGKTLVSSNDEYCPEISTLTFYQNSQFELEYDSCNPKGKIITLSGDYEYRIDSDQTINVNLITSFDGQPFTNNLKLNFEDNKNISSLKNVLSSWDNWSNYDELSILKISQIAQKDDQTNSVKNEKQNNNAITFLKVNHNMTNLKKTNVLEQEGYNCAELAGNFACAKGDSKIQILSERVQFNCNTYNGCAKIRCHFFFRKIGIDISSKEIIYYLGLSSTWRWTDGDRICVENNGTDVWLFKGSLGASYEVLTTTVVNQT